MTNLLVGKRAVYTRIHSERNKEQNKYIETKREAFRGTIAALITVSSSHYAAVVMLYDDGSLGQHDISAITIEGDQEGPFR